MPDPRAAAREAAQQAARHDLDMEEVVDSAIDAFATNLLSSKEKEALELSGKLANLIREIIGSGPQANNDWAEAAQRIHAVQHMILVQAAARAMPTEFRMLGGVVSA